jgi:geranylgeranyl diphosphate synthase type II
MGFNLSLCKEAIDERLRILTSGIQFPLKPIVEDALQGGQRLRPLLMLALTHDLAPEKSGKEFLEWIPLSLPIEIIHNAALILDDLPCMDNARTRRDRPPLYQKYGEMKAILAAFSLVGFSMESITKLSIDAELKEKFISILSKAIGPDQMSLGQCLDLTLPAEMEKKLTLLDVRGIYRQKTSVLFEAAVLFACHYRQVNERLRKKLLNWAERFGFLYQLRDDDIDQKEEAHGINAHRLFEKRAMEDIRKKEKRVLRDFFKDEKDGSIHFPSLCHFITLL